MSTDMLLPSEINSHHESIQAHSELHIVQWNGVAIRCQSQLCLRSMHSVNVHWSGCALRYQQFLPCIASFVLIMTVTTTVFRSRIASLHITCFTHIECLLNHQYLLCQQFQAQWMSTESPVSIISPVSHPFNVHWITSLCCLTGLKHTVCPLNHQPFVVSHQSEAQWMFTESPVSHQFRAQWTSAGTVLLPESHISLMSHQFHAQCMSTGMVLLSESLVSHVSRPVYVHWNGVAIRSTCHHVSVTMTLFMYAVKVPWCSVAIRDHQSVTAQSQFYAYSNVRWMVLSGWITEALPPLIHNVSYTHTHQMRNEKCCLPSKVTNHGHVLSTVHFSTEKKVTLHIAGHGHLTPTVHPDDSLMHAVNP